MEQYINQLGQRFERKEDKEDLVLEINELRGQFPEGRRNLQRLKGCIALVSVDNFATPVPDAQVAGSAALISTWVGRRLHDASIMEKGGDFAAPRQREWVETETPFIALSSSTHSIISTSIYLCLIDFKPFQ